MLVLDPEILVIDEPTSQLDPEGTESIFKIIRTLKEEGKTILLVEHKIDLLAEYADEVIVLEDGENIVNGPVHEVLVDRSLEQHGIQLPQISVIFDELRKKGLDFVKIPVTYEEARKLLIAT